MRNGFITLAQAAQWCGGTVAPEYASIAFHGAQFHSGDVCGGELFVALRGNRDGHDFVPDAIRRGAAAVLASTPLGAGIPAIYVGDTLAALQRIAKAWRERLSCRVIGVTGSVGKTTTKEMLAAILSTQFETVKTEKNYNNEIGVPVMALKLTERTEYAVLEMGMNHFGELSALTRIAQPDIAVITTIGTMHIENLGSREGILSAKLEILEGLRPDGIVLFNGDDDLLSREASRYGALTFGLGGENDIRAVDIVHHGGETEFTAIAFGKRIPICLPLAGTHNILDALAAIGVAVRCGVALERISAALRGFENTGHRQRIFTRNGVRIIDDCYNAGPESMRAALSVLRAYPARRIAVLGDMLELGEFAPQAHYEIGKIAAESAEQLYAYGEYAEEYVRGAQECGISFAQRYETHEALANALSPLSGDTILLKGSRGMHMERVLERLENNTGGNEHG